MFHIGILMLLFLFCLLGYVAASLCYNYYISKNQKGKDEVLRRIDRIAEEEGLSVEYVKISDKKENEKK